MLRLFSATMLLVGCAFFCCAQSSSEDDNEIGVPFFEEPIDDLAARALKEEKGLFIMLVANEEDTLVRHYLQIVLKDEEVVKAFENTIIAIKADTSSANGKALIERGFSNFPTVMFTTGRGEDLFEFENLIDPDQMIDILRRNVLNGSLKSR